VIGDNLARLRRVSCSLSAPPSIKLFATQIRANGQILSSQYYLPFGGPSPGSSHSAALLFQTAEWFRLFFSGLLHYSPIRVLKKDPPPSLHSWFLQLPCGGYPLGWIGSCFPFLPSPLVPSLLPERPRFALRFSKSPMLGSRHPLVSPSPPPLIDLRSSPGWAVGPVLLGF